MTFADANGDGFYTPGRDAKFLLGPAGITARDIAAAKAERGPRFGGWMVELVMNPEGRRALGALTARLVGVQLAMVFDRLVISAPTIQSPISSGQVALMGNFDEARAKEIAAALQPA